MRADCNRRILVIDDNLAIHEDFRKILRGQAEGHAFEVLSADFFGEHPAKSNAASFEIDSAFQGQEGLEMVRQGNAANCPYGVAFIDVRMPPGWDGIETAAQIWEICPDLQVVLCTAYTDYGWEGITNKLGKTDRLLILKKPFDPVEVLQLAETLSRKWTLAQQARLRLADLDAMVNRRTQELVTANAQLVQEIGVRVRTQVLLSAFAELGSLLSAARTVHEAGRIILDTASRLLGWDACLLHLYAPATARLTQVLKIEVVDGQRKECLAEAGETTPSRLMRKALQEGAQLVLKGGEIPAEELPFGEANRDHASLMLVPIRNSKEVAGLVALQSYGPDAYDQQNIETLQSLADHCGGALDRIRTEEALREAQDDLRRSQKLEAVGQLAAGIAHDFNNLLAVIRGNADLARMEADGFSNELITYLGQIIGASERAANLTRQLLTFSRKQMMQSEPVDLASVILNLSQMLKRLIGENIDLRYDDGNSLPLIQGDSGMLEQVLVNLVINARDAMPEGGQLLVSTEEVTLGAVAAQSHAEARPGHFLRLTVADTGCGISPEHLSQIFDPFFTTKEVGRGTGLGLATVYGIVKQHQGWIEVSSALGVGSQFRILLPALENAGALAKGQPAETGRTLHGNETILVVEDENEVRTITRLLLEHFGYRVLEAKSGPEALKVWQTAAAAVDLLLTDVIMPDGMNGRHLAEKLRAQKSSLKVIFQSGYGGEIMAGRQEDPGERHAHFLQKPCSPQDLLGTVRSCLDGAPVPREHFSLQAQSNSIR